MSVLKIEKYQKLSISYSNLKLAFNDSGHVTILVCLISYIEIDFFYVFPMFQIKTGCPKRNVPKRRSSLLTKEHFLGHPVCCESSGYFKFQQKSRKNLKLEWVHQ